MHRGNRKLITILLTCCSICLAGVLIFNLYVGNNSVADSPNIFIVTLSGVRNMDSIEDSEHQYIPHLWNDLRQKGTLYTCLVNENFEFHMPSIQAINFGVNSSRYSFELKSNLPSIFQYVRKKYRLPASKFWAIGHWFNSTYEFPTDKYAQNTFPCAFSLRNYSVSAQIFRLLTKQELISFDMVSSMMKRTSAQWPYWDSAGAIQYQVFKKIVRFFKPKLVHYVMNDVECAHYDSYAKYILALKASDNKIFELWQFINQDPFYKDKTYLIVNVDHGRNLYYAEHDEDTYDRPSKVWMYIYGPKVKKGLVISRSIRHLDIFATVAFLMNVNTHTTSGNLLKDCFSTADVYTKE